MKKCSKCGEEKELELFPISKGYAESWCKECKYEYTRKWRKANRDKVNATDKKWRYNNWEKYLEGQRKTYHKHLEANRKKNLEYYHSKSKKLGKCLSTIYRNGGIEKIKHLGDKCKLCRTKEDLCVHHKDNQGRKNIKQGLKPNNNLNNLQMLCRKCHSSLHAIKRKKYGKIQCEQV